MGHSGVKYEYINSVYIILCDKHITYIHKDFLYKYVQIYLWFYLITITTCYRLKIFYSVGYAKLHQLITMIVKLQVHITFRKYVFFDNDFGIPIVLITFVNSTSWPRNRAFLNCQFMPTVLVPRYTYLYQKRRVKH